VSSPQAPDLGVPSRADTAPRLASLDVLRAIAVLLVLGRHVGPLGEGWNLVAEGVLRLWGRGGWIGVDLFFVLSGFLVSGLLFREYRRRGAVSLTRFLVRRGLKIYPAFYFFLALGALRIALGQGLPALRVPALICEALFVQNYGPALWWHTWSLAVEEHFYLGCALLVLFLTRRARGEKDPYRSIPVIFLAVAAASLAARVVQGLAAPFTYATHLFPTHLRLDGLMFGVCLSYLHHFKPRILASLAGGRESALLGLGLALLAPGFLFPVESTFLMYTLGLTGLYLGSGLLVLVLVERGLPDRRLIRALAFLGAYSYSIYLWHLMVRFLVEDGFRALLHRPPGSPLAVLTYLVGAPVVGIAMAKLVEFPVLRWRDRLFPSRS
jgi:peptidoglycan/LPS O-acetylase OafA/YrhL